MTKYEQLSDVCIHPKIGNLESWLTFEIIAFYANLLVLIYYLIKSRFRSAESSIKMENDII